MSGDARPEGVPHSPEVTLSASVRYHEARRERFERLHRLALLVVILLSLATLAGWSPQITGFLTVVVIGTDLAFDFTGLARTHALAAHKLRSGEGT